MNMYTTKLAIEPSASPITPAGSLPSAHCATRFRCWREKYKLASTNTSIAPIPWWLMMGYREAPYSPRFSCISQPYFVTTERNAKDARFRNHRLNATRLGIRNVNPSTAKLSRTCKGSGPISFILVA